MSTFVVLAAMLALAAPGAPPRRHVEPSLGLSSTLMFESLILRTEGTVQRDFRLVSKPIGVELGVSFYLRRGDSFATGGWRGWALASAEVLLPRGLFPVGFDLAAAREYKVRPRLSLLLGGGIASRVTLPDPSLSHAQISLVLGLSLRRLDILYTPGMSIPLAHERSSVLVGSHQHGTPVSHHHSPLWIHLRSESDFSSGGSPGSSFRRA